MIYDVNAPDYKHRRFRIFDANGLEWKCCTRIDTETGEITRYKTDKGRFELTPDGNELVTETIRTAAPLLVVEFP